MYGIPFITQPEILENYQIHHIGLLCFSQYHDLLAYQVTHNRYLTKACPDAGSRGLVNSAATPHTITATFGLGGRNRRGIVFRTRPQLGLFPRASCFYHQDDISISEIMEVLVVILKAL